MRPPLAPCIPRGKEGMIFSMNSTATLLLPGFGLLSAQAPAAEGLVRGSRCVVQLEEDLLLGTFLSSKESAPPPPPSATLLREATPSDLLEEERCLAFAREVQDTFLALLSKYDLQTRRLGVVSALGRKKVFLWHCPRGILPDMRSFEGEFRRKIRCSVQLFELGARSSAAFLGGCGCCGRSLCCAHGLKPKRELSPHEASMLAGSSLPTAINGLCNCPKCCLEFP